MAGKDKHILTDEEFDKLMKTAMLDVFEEEMASLPSDEEIKAMYTISKRHKKRMTKLLAPRKPSVFERKRKWSVATAIATLVFLIVTVPIFGQNVIATMRTLFTEWTEEFVRFTSTTPTNQDVVDNIWRPTKIPFEHTYYVLIDTIDSAWIEYEKNDLPILWFQYALSEMATFTIDIENATYHQISEHGITFYVFVSDNSDFPSSVVWENQGFLFLINGFLNTVDLLDISLSVKSIPTP